MKKFGNERINYILSIAEDEMFKLNHPYVGTEHLMLSLLKLPRIQKIMNKYNVTYDIFLNELINVIGKSNIKSEYTLYTPLLNNVLKDIDEHSDEITLLKNLISSDDGIAIRILLCLDTDLESLYNELTLNKKYLDEIGKNITQMEINDVLIGRDKEIDNIIEILLRKIKNNPILIGEAGIGKSAIVMELAKRIKNNQVPNKLKGYNIYMLDMASLLSNTKYRGEFETKMNNIIKEIEDNEIILFIDEIHTIVKTGGGEGSCDAANILKPYLSSDKVKLIGATTSTEYEEFIAPDSALARRFVKVYIKEPSIDETKVILKGIKNIYEEYHGKKIDDSIIDLIVDNSTKYILNRNNPDKSLEVMDLLLSRMNMLDFHSSYDITLNEYINNHDYKNALKLKKNIIKPKVIESDILSVIESIANIKILTLKDYKKICKYLDNKIKYQDLSKLKNIIKEKCLNNKTIGFTLKGEKNTGKYYTTQVLKEIFNYKCIELDMKEYTSDTSINRLIGADAGYIGYNDNSILDSIIYEPYTLIILKNVEYANSNILNLFKSIVDKGYFINKKNKKIDFNFTMIISLDNSIRNSIGYNNTLEEDDYTVRYNKIPLHTLINE